MSNRLSQAVLFYRFVHREIKHLFFRAWRQKIEAWLQENEKEEKQNEELRRRSRRVQSNRRSLEADSGTQFFVCCVHGCIMASEIGAEHLHGIKYRLSGSVVRHSKAHAQNFLLGEWVPSPEAIYNVCLI